jgi:peptide/nickel transport system substrate-binding protein
MDFEQLAKRRGSRRWFLGVSAAAGAGASLTAVGCGGGTKTVTPFGSPIADYPSPTARRGSPTAATTGPQSGGTLYYTGFVAADASPDPDKTSAGPFYGQQSMVFSRLLTYASQANGSLAVDLATNMPEQPDAQTLIFRINPNARWHESDPLNGRPLTAQDVKYSFDRQIGGDASFGRKARWATIDKVDAPDASTVSFHLSSPLAGMAGSFADVDSLVVAPELLDHGRQFSPDSQIGSGPFRWVDWSEGQFASVSRNPAWHGGNKRPLLDGVTVVQPKDARDVEAQLRTYKLDAAFVGLPQADKLKGIIPALQEQTVGHSLFFGMRFFSGTPPFNDVRVRTALSIAFDRRDMIQQFFAGSGDINPWVSWPITSWALPQSELVNLPGYRPGAPGRDQDIADAQKMLSSYTKERDLPETLNLYVLDEAETALKMGSVMKAQAKKALGVDVTAYPVTRAQLGAGLIAGTYAWSAAPDIGWIDLDDWVFPLFHSQGTRNTFPLRDADMDKLIEAQRTELDANARRAIGFDIQRKLLVINPAVNFVSERLVALVRPYVRNFPTDVSDGYQDRFADCWIDRSDPDFKGRA